MLKLVRKAVLSRFAHSLGFMKPPGHLHPAASFLAQVRAWLLRGLSWQPQGPQLPVFSSLHSRRKLVPEWQFIKPWRLECLFQGRSCKHASHLKCSQPRWGNRKPLLAGARALVSCPNVVTQVEVSGGDQPAILNRSIVPTYLPATKSGRREIGLEARLMRRLAALSIWKAHSGYCLQTQSAFHRYLVKCRFPKDAGSELGVSRAPGQSGRKI